MKKKEGASMVINNQFQNFIYKIMDQIDYFYYV